MNQLSINFDPPRERGRASGEACQAKAERVTSFDSAGAAEFVLRELRNVGQMSGETLTDLATAHGYRPHDARAFGPVFAGLVRRGLIRCAGYCTRSKGHGTSGGRIWAAVR
jgi:hypothetical protein